MNRIQAKKCVARRRGKECVEAVEKRIGVKQHKQSGGDRKSVV